MVGCEVPTERRARGLRCGSPERPGALVGDRDPRGSLNLGSSDSQSENRMAALPVEALGSDGTRTCVGGCVPEFTSSPGISCGVGERLGSSVPRGQGTRGPSGDWPLNSDGGCSRRAGLQETTGVQRPSLRVNPLGVDVPDPCGQRPAWRQRRGQRLPLPALETESTPGTASPSRRPATGGAPRAHGSCVHGRGRCCCDP